VRLSAAIDGFLLTKQVAGLSPNTLRNYTHSLDRFAGFLDDDLQLAEITKADLQRFMVWLMTAQFPSQKFGTRGPQTLSAKTVRNVHTCLCSLWTWAIKEGYTTEHIPKQVEAPRPEPPEIVPFTKEQIRDLLEAARFSRPWAGRRFTQTELPKEQYLRDKAIILFLLDTGVRASELCQLVVGDLDLQTGTATVQSKGRRNAGQGKRRTVHFETRTKKALWQYLAHRAVLGQDIEPLFCTRAGDPMTRENLRGHLHKIGKRANVNGVYPHRFRHTFAIQYLRNGGDLFTLQRLLGHSAIESTRRYLHIAQADLEIAHQRASPVDNWRL